MRSSALIIAGRTGGAAPLPVRSARTIKNQLTRRVLDSLMQADIDLATAFLEVDFSGATPDAPHDDGAGEG